jgi:hypothetical protein
MMRNAWKTPDCDRPGNASLLSGPLRTSRWWPCWLAASGLLAWSVPVFAADPVVRLNQIQVIGTHNSYHLEPVAAVRALIAASGERQAQALEYTHRPLAEQFTDLGIRQIELDLFADPEGGRYAQPAGATIVQNLGQDPGLPLDPDQRLAKPGLKVLHVPDIDYRTTVLTFVDALQQIRDWSRSHPWHVPILVLLELKEQATPALPTKPLPFDRDQLEALEREILSVFPRHHILTPDDVRGDHGSLPQAIQTRGWPPLDQVRGRVVFALDNEDQVRDRYLEGHPALRGRLLFASVPETDPAAAWFKVNDPVRHDDRIRSLVEQGYLVRTRADAETREARTNDPRRRERALASGAQFVSTDYPVPDPRLSSYCVRLPGQIVARANPISGRDLPQNVELETKP